MNTSELKEQILLYLAEQYEEGKAGMVALKPLAERLGIPFEFLRPVIGMLHQQGVLKTVAGEAHASLTPQGIEIALPRDPAVPHPPPQTVNFNGPITQSAIAMNQGHANAETNTHVQSFISNLSQAIDQADGVTDEQKRGWKQALFELSKHPAVLAVLSTLVT